MLEYLIESGFDFTVRNKKQKTPLMLAIENYSNASVVEYLIQNKVDVNIHDIDGNTPLHIAAMKCELEIIKVLIREGSDLNAKNNKLQTPLHVVGQGFEPLFRDILEKGDDTEILNLSRDLKIETIIMLLLENGADANTLDNEGKSPFYYLHRIISIELKMKFINSGADLTIKDNSGVSIMVSMFELGTRHY